MRKRSAVGTPEQDLADVLKQSVSTRQTFVPGDTEKGTPAVNKIEAVLPGDVEIAPIVIDVIPIVKTPQAAKDVIAAAQIDTKLGDKNPVPMPPPLFMSSNKGPGIAPDFERIVETLYQVDAWKEYEDLERNLEVSDDETSDYAALRRALNKAESRARRAHKLLVNAQLERKKWELDTEVVNAAIRQKAIDDVEADKVAGRLKRITNDDVQARMVTLHRDEYLAQEIKRKKLSGMEQDLEHLVKRWDAKCGDLRVLLETLRR